MKNGQEEAIVSASEIGVDPEQLWQTADKLRILFLADRNVLCDHVYLGVEPLKDKSI